MLAVSHVCIKYEQYINLQYDLQLQKSEAFSKPVNKRRVFIMASNSRTNTRTVQYLGTVPAGTTIKIES